MMMKMQNEQCTSGEAMGVDEERDEPPEELGTARVRITTKLGIVDTAGARW